jgi:hypothetical protein
MTGGEQILLAGFAAGGAVWLVCAVRWDDRRRRPRPVAEPPCHVRVVRREPAANLRDLLAERDELCAEVERLRTMVADRLGAHLLVEP